MSIDEIRERRNAKPFCAFDILMDDGRTVHVERPSSIALAPSGKTIVVADGDAFSVFEVSLIRELSVEENARGTSPAQ